MYPLTILNTMTHSKVSTYIWSNEAEDLLACFPHVISLLLTILSIVVAMPKHRDFEIMPIEDVTLSLNSALVEPHPHYGIRMTCYDCVRFGYNELQGSSSGQMAH